MADLPQSFPSQGSLDPYLEMVLRSLSQTAAGAQMAQSMGPGQVSGNPPPANLPNPFEQAYQQAGMNVVDSSKANTPRQDYSQPNYARTPPTNFAKTASDKSISDKDVHPNLMGLWNLFKYLNAYHQGASTEGSGSSTGPSSD